MRRWYGASVVGMATLSRRRFHCDPILAIYAASDADFSSSGRLKVRKIFP